MLSMGEALSSILNTKGRREGRRKERASVGGSHL
jgi:hypothetical protein